jgi:hypothetical protein
VVHLVPEMTVPGTRHVLGVSLAVLATITAGIGVAHHPLPQRITPHREVYLVGISVFVLILVATVVVTI